jgi:non-canonical poly(A) RNA polymerase PAPD5/7
VHDSASLRLHRELLDFAKWIAPSNEEHYLRLITVNCFRGALSILWPKARVICSGSTATRSYLPNGDIDLIVYNAPREYGVYELLEMIKWHLDDLKMFRNSTIIQASVPIIKGSDYHYGFDVDISVNSENGILNIERQKNYFKEFPGLYPTLMFLKVFLFQNGLDVPYNGGISSNTLMQMIIFVVQMLNPQEAMNVGSICLRFLKCFGNEFNYVTTGLTTRNHGRTFSLVDANQVNYRNWCGLSIEDPQNPGVFVGRNAYECRKVREKCGQAFCALNRHKSERECSALARVVNADSVEELMRRRDRIKKSCDEIAKPRRIKKRFPDDGHRSPPFSR